MCPRRFGKSVSVAMLAAGLLFVCPKIVIVILATTQTISSKLLGMIAVYYNRIKGSAGRTINRNQKAMIVVAPGF